MRTLDDWLAHQQALHPRTIDLGLDRVRAIALRLGLLPPTTPTVLVGGTNGKGSTVAFLVAIARAAGLRVGSYTSPHLLRYNERVALDGQPVPDDRLIAAFERIETARGSSPLTFFEYGTLAAFDVFQRERVDVAIVEVGLGGRLDATNVFDPDVSVVCSVGLDHMDLLGPTVEHIGAEKAGIFRQGRPAVLGAPDMPASVTSAIRRLGALRVQAGSEFAARRRTDSGDGRWDWSGGRGTHSDLPPPALDGDVQYANAATAIAAWLELCACAAGRWPQQAAAAATATATLRAGVAAARVAGRFQRVAGSPEWILDVAHNPAAAAVLAGALRSLPREGRVYAVAGVLADKDVAGIGAALAGEIDDWILCGLDGPRALDAEALRQRLPGACRSVALVPDVPTGCALARAMAGPRDRVVVLGSFHTVGPALQWLGLY
jgi:dihydrofolate synthase/folylpolyglutamate synthase